MANESEAGMCVCVCWGVCVSGVRLGINSQICDKHLRLMRGEGEWKEQVVCVHNVMGWSWFSSPYRVESIRD